jgi:hypothetical protein
MENKLLLKLEPADKQRLRVAAARRSQPMSFTAIEVLKRWLDEVEPTTKEVGK